MEAITTERRAAMLAEYQRVRQLGITLNNELVRTLDKQAIDEAGRKLGILVKGVLHFDTQDTVCVLMDYALRHVRRGGMNAIERYLAESPPPPGSAELRWLQMVRPVRYGVLAVEETFPRFGLQVHDILRDERLLLLDVAFSETVPRGAVLASHVYTTGEYWMTSGAALPLSADTLVQLVRQLARRFGNGPGEYRGLSEEEHTGLATLVIRTCLDTGMAQHISYGEEPPEMRHGPHALRGPVRTRVGRNDPCPCGSGRKFKNCCRGQAT